MFAYNLPPIIGLGTGSGFEYQLQSLAGATPAEIAAVARGLVFAANQNPALSRVFTTYSASTPQLYLDIDREKVQTLGIDLSEVFNALQSVLGSAYVNDFNLFGRTWQVNIQGEAAERTRIADIYRINVRNNERRDGAGPRLRRCAAGARAAVGGPLQQLPQRDAQRRAGARLFLRRRARRDGADFGDDAAARLRLRMDRHRVAGEGGGRQDHDHPRARGRVCLSVPGRPLRKHGDPGAGAAVGFGRRARRR